MKKLFITAYKLFYGVDKSTAASAYRVANQAYRKEIVSKLIDGSDTTPIPEHL